LNSALCLLESALPLEPCPQSFLLKSFFRQGLWLSALTGLEPRSPDLCSPSAWD
jgi:hypothetical protein